MDNIWHERKKNKLNSFKTCIFPKGLREKVFLFIILLSLFQLFLKNEYFGFDKYFIQGIPTLIFIDKNGNVADFKIGSGNEQEIVKKIQKLLNA